MSTDRSEKLNSQNPGYNGSEIAEFYKGAKILVTGGTGFLGLLTIEKLLRSCPDIATIYMLIRQKKGKSVEERIKQYFNDTVFSRLKQEQPDFLNKIVVIEGDAAEENFGLSAQSILTLNDTNIVIHAAAIVKFNEKLRLVVHTNVRITKQLLLWAKTLPNLKSFVYVSTAFSNCVHETIDEIHYDPPMDCDKLMTLVDCLDDDKLLAIEATLRGKWPNNYIFSKSTAENVVLKYAGDLPVGIVRPSIVTATFHEPLEGWINNINGATGLLVGGAIGLLHTLHCLPEYASEIIPADYVVSNTIAASWDINKRLRGKWPNNYAFSKSTAESVVLKYAGWINNINGAAGIAFASTLGLMHTMHCVSECAAEVIPADYVVSNIIAAIWDISKRCLTHEIVPAAIVDTFSRLAGHKPMLMDAYAKMDKFGDVISFFTTQQWKFRDENVKKLWSKLGPIDRRSFNFNVADINWPEYFDVYMRGIRVYSLKDPLTEESIRAGRSKFWKLNIANYVVMTLYALLVLWIVYSLVALPIVTLAFSLVS
nr:putative fatty acyl-CoA reductase CG5065 [Megalopta genalis]